MIPSKLAKGWQLPPKPWRFLIIIVLVIGIFFRFANLDKKLYWIDETFTSLRIYGYTKQEVTNEVIDSEIITTDFLHNYQKPTLEKGLLDVVESLALEDPKHPPLYFVITRLWTKVFGNSAAVIRSFSAFISLFAFPSIYWLCLELFGSSFVAWIAVTLIAVSPFHVLYAQEARMYALHTVNILLSSAVLLRAIRINTKLSWGFYVASIFLGLYTHTTFFLVVILHGIYIVLNKGIRLEKIFVSYLKASLLGLLLFSPWLYLILSKVDEVKSTIRWMNNTLSLDDLRIGWEVHFVRIFFDVNPNYEYDNPISDNLWWITIRVFLVLFLYSVYFLVRHSQKKTYTFILILIIFPALVFALPDLFFGGMRSIVSRYAIITYLGCHLAFTYLFAHKIKDNYLNQEKNQQYLWSLLLIILISIEIISCTLSASKLTWWNKSFNSDNLPISNILNKESSLLISECNLSSLRQWDGQFGHLLSLSYHLDNKVKLQCFDNFQQIDISKIPNEFDAYFILNPPPSLKDKIKSQYRLKLEPIYENNMSLFYENNMSLWKLEK